MGKRVSAMSHGQHQSFNIDCHVSMIGGWETVNSASESASNRSEMKKTRRIGQKVKRTASVLIYMAKGNFALYHGSRPVIDSNRNELDEMASPSVVVDALAAAAEIDPLEVPALYEYIDPDLIDNLFDQNVGPTGTGPLLGFRVEKWNVFVNADGRILICDATDPLPEPELVFKSD